MALHLLKTINARFFGSKKQAGYGTSRTGRVSAGREAFVLLNDKEKKQKKSLLRKLNVYRDRKSSKALLSYQTSGDRSRGGRTFLLVSCLLMAIGLFLGSNGPLNIKKALEKLDYFKITSISVNGCNETSAEKVRSESGIKINSSILSLDEEAITADVKEQNGWVRSVEIIRKWPDSVVIKIHEYEPHALISLVEGERPGLYYMDKSGEPFVQADSEMELDFPVITGLEKISDEAVRSKRINEALQFLRLIRANNPNLPAQSVSEINIDSEEGLVVYLVEYPFPVFFGHGDIRKKYIRLRKVLEVLYKPGKKGMEIAQVTYIRMDYLTDKVIVGYSESG